MTKLSRSWACSMPQVVSASARLVHGALLVAASQVHESALVELSFPLPSSRSVKAGAELEAAAAYEDSEVLHHFIFGSWVEADLLVIAVVPP